MKSDSSDDRVRQALAEVRRHSLEEAPAFGPMWVRASRALRKTEAATPSGPLWRHPLTMMVAALALVALGLGGILSLGPWHSAEPDRVTAIAASISQWEAPLDFLLDTPGREWLATTPNLGNPKLFDLDLNPLDLDRSKLDAATDPVGREGDTP